MGEMGKFINTHIHKEINIDDRCIGCKPSHKNVQLMSKFPEILLSIVKFSLSSNIFNFFNEKKKERWIVIVLYIYPFSCCPCKHKR